MKKTPFQIRLEDDLMKALADTAARLQVSKTSIIEDALAVRLKLLNGYVEMDKGPPKTAKVVKVTGPKTFTMSAGIVDPSSSVTPRTKAKPVVLTGGAQRVRGWDAAGQPIY